MRSAAELCLRAVAALILARGRMLGEAAPFGLAFVAACGGGAEGFAALLGGSVGYLLCGALEEGLRLTAGCVLAFALAVAFPEAARRRNFLPLSAGCIHLLTALVTHAGDFTARASAVLTGQTALCVLGVYAFRAGLAGLRAPRRVPADPFGRLGLCAMALCAMTALSQVELLGALSLGRLCAAAAVLSAAYATGAGAGAAAGLTLGLVLDVSSATDGFCALACGVGGLAAGLGRNRARVVAGVGYACGWCVVRWWQWGVKLTGMWWLELVLGGALFLLVPGGWLERLGLVLKPKPCPPMDSTRLDAARATLSRTAEAFQSVFSALKTAFPPSPAPSPDPADVLERAAQRVCARCGMRESCWQKDYNDTHDLLTKALSAMEETGRVEAEGFPPRFRQKCCRFGQFRAEAERQWREHLLLGQMERRLAESRAAVREEYGVLAQALEEAAEALAAPETLDPRRSQKLSRFLAGRELDCRGRVSFDRAGRLLVRLEGADAAALSGLAGQESLSSLLDVPLAELSASGAGVLYGQREPLKIFPALSALAREGEGVSGDGGVWFAGEDGMYYAILCDGMGSGLAAREDSRVTMEILERLLRAGVRPENALGTLDRALALRFEGDGGFAALDLLTIDLFSGAATLYKLGAPGSYLRRGGTVVKLCAQSLPAGAERERRLKKLCFRLSPGDAVVLITDGILAGEEDDSWLKNAVAELESAAAEELAGLVTRHGKSRQDDRTALVLRVGLNNPA